MVPGFPESLQRTLRKCFDRFFTADEIGLQRAFARGYGSDDWRVAHPADEIVFQLLGAAYPLKVKLYRHKNFSLTKGEMLAEHADFLKSLRTVQKKLRSLSPELDRLLGNHADPLGIADLMDDLIARVERATSLVKRHPDLERDRVFNSRVARELVHAVLDIFDANNLTIAARVGSAGGASLLISTVKCIGDAMKLALDDKTWKRNVLVVRRGKNKAPSAAR